MWRTPLGYWPEAECRTFDNVVDERGTNRMNKRVLSAGTIGTVLEWYDFNLYSTASALVFARLFFPGDDSVLGTLASFATFAVGFFFRPLGGVLLGNLGDRIGRRTVLMISLVLMGTATTLIGVLPTYGSIGFWAPVLLVILRAVQGMGAGAEYAGAIALTTEHSVERRRGLFGSIPAMGIGLGNIAATGILALVSSLSEEDFLYWGWRLPFLASLVVVGFGLIIRLRVPESEVFEATRKRGGIAKVPMLKLVRTAPKPLFLSFLANIGPNVAGYVPSVFSLTYLTQQVHADKSIGLNALLVANTTGLVVTPIFGALCDRVNRRAVYLSGALFCALTSFPFFWLLDTGTALGVTMAILLMLTVGDGAMLGSQPALLAEAFPTQLRYSGVALSRELSAALIGGTAPLVATALYQAGGKSPWLVAIYMLVLYAVSGLGAALLGAQRRYRIGDEVGGSPNTTVTEDVRR